LSRQEGIYQAPLLSKTKQMKKLFTTIFLSVMLYALPSTAHNKGITIKVSHQALKSYTGKYQMLVKGKAVFIEIKEKGDQLTLTSLWDNQSNKIKQLSGDNFIMEGHDWSVKFLRDAKGTVNEVVVMGTDHWKKVSQ